MLRVGSTEHRHDAWHTRGTAAKNRIDERARLARIVEQHVRCGSGRGGLTAIERGDALACCVEIQHECAATDAGALWLHKAEHRLHSHRGIRGAAATRQYRKPGFHGQRMCSRDARRPRRDQLWRGHFATARRALAAGEQHGCCEQHKRRAHGQSSVLMHYALRGGL